MPMAATELLVPAHWHNSATSAVTDAPVPQWRSAIGRNTSPSAVSAPNAAPTPTSHQTTRFSGRRRNPIAPTTQNGSGPTRIQPTSEMLPSASDTPRAAASAP